ncbi:hypothetical protein [Gleimia europaea]|uniref:hypothetical protein n=1 Tax=Gleimia europaea TaxID=66228 RepID=UPI002789E3FD|nr:hypothetical protein [Gleimia europaea]MDP9834952.1 putative membrane protein YkoI [Gleimia europaea]
MTHIGAEYGLEPAEIDGKLVLSIDPKTKKTLKLTQALKRWKKMANAENSGEITAADLDRWKAEFGA